MPNGRIIIETIKIRNFRSIKSATIDARNLNIFVGLNDVGKSNVLKALNLFFNDQTDYGIKFDFDRDFSYYYTKESHRRKEIVIEIQFNIPEYYKESGVFTWTKTWKADEKTDEILNSAGEKPSVRSRVPGALRRIRYRYVPAVKSKEYYKSLLSDLYYTVSSVLGSPLESSVREFSNVLKTYTSQISDEVINRVGINSSLSIPDNLSELFTTLVFQTNSGNNDAKIPLDMRGDGIQARHIPIVLKYIADEDQKTRNQGSMKVSTIWGFEEPENGVELSRVFDMAKDFSDYSSDIQMFITTHSPAFYTIDNSEASQVFYVKNGKNNEGTLLCDSEDMSEVGYAMGLMPIVAPYIAKQEQILNETRKLYSQQGIMDIPTIFVEGESDKKLLDQAISLFFPVAKQMINNNKLRVFTKPEEGGCTKLVDLALSWEYSGNHNKAVVLFDKDSAGAKSRAELVNSEVYRRNNSNVKAIFIEPTDNIKEVLRVLPSFSYEMEHLFSLDCWLQLKKKKYLQDRPIEELTEMVRTKLSRDKSVNSVLNELIPDKHLLMTIVLLNPHDEKKMKIANYILGLPEETQKEYLQGLIPTLEKIKNILRITD